jgi:heme/copper-type cytochrome/quinol oxidase subunit 2
MELSGKNRIVLTAVVIVVIVVVVALFVFVGMRKGNAPGATVGNTAVTASSSAAASATHLPAPANVIVPEAGAQNAPAGVAVPQVEAPAAPGVSSKYRSFDIIVQNNEFMPSTVAVNLGDTVNLQIGAVGGDYDFTQPDLGFKVALPAGEDKNIQFAAITAGKFVFYCSSCGGPAKGPVGYIIVAGQ